MLCEDILQSAQVLDNPPFFVVCFAQCCGSNESNHCCSVVSNMFQPVFGGRFGMMIPRDSYQGGLMHHISAVVEREIHKVGLHS